MYFLSLGCSSWAVCLLSRCSETALYYAVISLFAATFFWNEVLSCSISVGCFTGPKEIENFRDL